MPCFPKLKFPLLLCLFCSGLGTGVALLAEDGTASTELDLDTALEEARAIGKTRRDKSGNEWLIAPIPSYSPSFGWTLAVPVARLYRPESTSPDDPAWMTGVGGFYSQNTSWGVGLFHRMNLKKDQWRFMSALAYSEVVYNYYGFGSGGGQSSRYIEISQNFGGGTIEGLYHLGSNIYAGLRMVAMQTEITRIGFPSVSVDYPEVDIGISRTILNITPRVVYDTRDNEFYPRSGQLIDFLMDISAKSWGSDYEYNLYKLSWNYYQQLAENQILAFRFAGKYASANAPFFLLPTMGKGSDLRGYLTGVYRDQALLAGQIEYRLRLTRRFGIVAFAGIGAVGSGLDDMGESLPSYGGGVRWVLAEENDISLRVDVGWGKDNHEIYVGVGEAF